MLRLREVAEHILSLVPLAALDRDGRTEHLAHGRAQSLGAVEDDQQAGRCVEAALHQLAQESGAHTRILGGRLHEAEEALLPRRGDAQRDEDLIVGEGLPVEQEHQPLGIIVTTRVQRRQRLGAGADEAPRHARLGQAERLWHRFGRRFVVATGEPAQDPAK